jgi:hypothetical protein
MAPVLRALPLSGEIRVDGVLDDAAWQMAEAYSDFLQREPNEGEPASERTEVRILVDSDAIYVGARMWDSDPSGIRATLVRRDVVSDFDYVILNLDSRHDHNTSYAFTLTPSGAFQDAARGTDGSYDFGWDPVWDGAASIDDQGWSAEWKIPFSQLRFESAEDAVWGIQIDRVIARTREHDVFAFTPLGEAGGPHRYGHLVGLGSVEEPDRLEILPYVTTRSEHLNVDPGDPFRSNADRFGGAGVDLKYGITGNLTLDATLNPDFGQVEADPAVVNLTQYESYFSERRPFFVEGSEIFRFGFSGGHHGGGNSLFYSRRIGRAPRGGFSDVDAAYTDAPDQSTIAAAAKLSGRIGAWSVGLLEAATLEEEGRYATASGHRGTVTVEPFSNYVVGRARRDFNDGNATVGALFTAANRNLSDAALTDLMHSSAYVAGVDFIRNWKNREWFLTGKLAGSRVAGDADAILLTQRSSARYWQRPDASHVEVDPTRTSILGWQGSLSAGRRAGDHWLGSVSMDANSPGFEANDLGFNTQVDSWGTEFALQYRDMVPDERTRRYQIDLMPSFRWNFDGDLVGASAFLGSFQQWANFWSSSITVNARAPTADDRLTRGGPMARRPGAIGFSGGINTDQRKPYTFHICGNLSKDTEGGWNAGSHAAVTFRPTSAMEVRIDTEYRRNHPVAQYVGAFSDPVAENTYGARYVFGELDQTTLSTSARVSWTFTPDLSLQLWAQPFISTGRYQGFKELQRPREWAWNAYGEDVGTLAESDGQYLVDPDGDGPAEGFSFSNPDFNVRSLRGNAVLRWEYRPGSTVYLVWQQRRSSFSQSGEFDFSDDADALFGTPPENVFAIKVSYWMGR